jgi:Major capsid protein N-terminus
MKGILAQLEYNRNSRHNYLTKNPIKNFFVDDYPQYQDFGSYKSTLQFDNKADYNRTIKVTIPKSKGDLLRSLHLNLSLDRLVSTSGTYACYTNTIGYAVIDTVYIKVGETIYAQKSSEELEIQNYVENHRNTDESRNLLVGRYSNLSGLVDNALAPSSYIIPLYFWFSDDLKKAFPLYLLNHQAFTVEIKLKPFSQVVNYDGLTQPIQNVIVEASLLCEFSKIPELTKSIQKSLQMTNPIQICIQQSEYSKMNLNSKVSLKIAGDATEILVVARKTTSVDNNDFFNYSDSGNNILDTIAFWINGIEYIERTDERVFRLLKNDSFNSRYIYSLPFSEYPEKWYEPSGSLNFNEIKESEFHFSLDGSISGEIIVITKKYNWIRITDNMADLILF